MLIWWYFISRSSHINLDVDIHARDDKEDPRPPGSSCEEATQSEDDGSLVLLDHLHHEEEREWEEDENQKYGETSEQSGANTRPVLTI